MYCRWGGCLRVGSTYFTCEMKRKFNLAKKRRDAFKFFAAGALSFPWSNFCNTVHGPQLILHSSHLLTHIDHIHNQESTSTELPYWFVCCCVAQTTVHNAHASDVHQHKLKILHLHCEPLKCVWQHTHTHQKTAPFLFSQQKRNTYICNFTFSRDQSALGGTNDRLTAVHGTVPPTTVRCNAVCLAPVPTPVHLARLHRRHRPKLSEKHFSLARLKGMRSSVHPYRCAAGESSSALSTFKGKYYMRSERGEGCQTEVIILRRVSGI